MSVGESQVLVHADDLEDTCTIFPDEGRVCCSRCMCTVGIVPRDTDGGALLYKFRLDAGKIWDSYNVDSILGEAVLAEGDSSGARHFSIHADSEAKFFLNVVNASLLGTSSGESGLLHPRMKVLYHVCSEDENDDSAPQWVRGGTAAKVVKFPADIAEEMLSRLEEATSLLPSGSREFRKQKMGHLVW